MAEGPTLAELCNAIHKRASLLQGEELDELKAWIWFFGLQLTDYLVRVGLAAAPEAECDVGT